MQKTSKPVRQLQYHSGTRNAGYSGGIEQEEGIDSIRFCDVTGMPNRDAHAHITSSVDTAAVGSAGQSGVKSSADGTKESADKDYSKAVQVVPVLPASMLEDVPLSVLLAQSVGFIFFFSSYISAVLYLIFEMARYLSFFTNLDSISLFFMVYSFTEPARYARRCGKPQCSWHFSCPWWCHSTECATR